MGINPWFFSTNLHHWGGPAWDWSPGVRFQWNMDQEWMTKWGLMWLKRYWNSWFTHWTWWFSIVMLVYQTLIKVGKTMSCLPPMTGNGMNGKLLAPIKMVKLGMVYYCFTMFYQHCHDFNVCFWKCLGNRAEDLKSTDWMADQTHMKIVSSETQENYPQWFRNASKLAWTQWLTI